MKKITAWFLLAALMMSLAACAAESGPENGGKTGEDLSGYTATELYALAADKTELLPSYELETTISGEEDVVIWNTRRARAGYDRFYFSRTKNTTAEGVYFNGDTAWVVSPEGSFSAPASTVSFRNYWATEGFPVMGLDMEHFVRIERDGLTVSYGEADEVAAASFAALADFTVTGVEGKAVIDEGAFIREEEIRVTGTLADGGEKTVVLKTRMISHGGKDFEVAAPPADLPVMQVNDIRLPALLQKARAGLLDSENVSLVLVSRQSAGGIVRSAVGDFNGVGGAYSLRQTETVTAPEAETRSSVSHLLAENGTVRYAAYDGVTGETVTDETVAAEGDKAALSVGTCAAASSAALAQLIPSSASFASAEMTEEAAVYQLSFTLNETAVAALAQEVCDRIGVLPDAGKLTADGSMTVSKADGSLASVFYEAKDADGNVYARLSVNASYGGAALAPVTPPAADELY